MPASITTVPIMSAITPVQIATITIPSFNTNVSIFTSTMAIEVPAKLNAVATDVKNFLRDELTTPINAFINNSIASITTANNTAVTTITSYINDVIINDINLSLSSINSDNITFQVTLLDDVDVFKNTLLGNIAGLLGVGAGYTINQSNDLIFGGMSEISLNSSGRVSSYTSGVRTVSNVTYNDDGLIVSYMETILNGVISYSKQMTVLDTTSSSLITAS